MYVNKKKLPNIFIHYQNKKIYTLRDFIKKYWGFCLTDLQKRIKRYNNSDKFKVVIKSKFNKRGNLNYGISIPGKSQEILISVIFVTINGKQRIIRPNCVNNASTIFFEN